MCNGLVPWSEVREWLANNMTASLERKNTELHQKYDGSEVLFEIENNYDPWYYAGIPVYNLGRTLGAYRTMTLDDEPVWTIIFILDDQRSMNGSPLDTVPGTIGTASLTDAARFTIVNGTAYSWDTGGLYNRLPIPVRNVHGKWIPARKADALELGIDQSSVLIRNLLLSGIDSLTNQGLMEK